MSVAAAPAGRGSYAIGVGLVVAAGGFLSLGGLILRHIETANGWQVLFFRSLTMMAVTLAILAWQYRGRIDRPFRGLGWGGFVAGASLAISMIGYVFSLLLTTVANAMFVLSTIPFMVAVLAWLWLGERVHRLTWLAIAIAVAGMGVMVADGLAGDRVDGLAVALLCAVTFAITLVLLRRFRHLDMLPALTLGSALSALAAALVAGDLAAPARDILLASLMGIVQFGIGFVLVILGSRRVPAAEVSLLLLIEPILSPIWVWIAVAEAPSRIALAGGLIVFAAVAAQTIAGVLWERRAGARPD
jgi:drug/metabolite transporter (DMT)-like permease